MIRSGDRAIGSSSEGKAFARLATFDSHIQSADDPITRLPLARSSDDPITRFPWNVVHACEQARDVLPLVEGQLAIGMRPHLLTPAGFGPARYFLGEHRRESAKPIALLQAWSHVREWRKLLNESSVETFAEMVHAHSFAAGMAAVRASSAVVYQMREPVEKIAARNGSCEGNSWLARSFRVAEQFVLTRAAAVVVHTRVRRDACIARGVNAEQLFCIPEPLSVEMLESTPNQDWLRQFVGAGSETTVFAVPSLSSTELWQARDAMQRWMRVLSVVRQGCREVKFIILAGPHLSADVQQLASACKLAPFVKVLEECWQRRALESADIVICDTEHSRPSETFDAGNPELPLLPALEAQARGRALLAADVEAHREVTSDGRGCLWFRAGDIEDIAHRALFLARNAGFREALGRSGRQHCLATRGSEAVAAQYDAVYRLAFTRRKSGDGTTPKPQLIPLEAAS